MAVAIAVAATIDPASGRGSAALAPLLHSDDEADLEAAACSTHFSDLPAPNLVTARAVWRKYHQLHLTSVQIHYFACLLMRGLCCLCHEIIAFAPNQWLGTVYIDLAVSDAG